MKKYFLSFLAVLLILIFLSSCSKNEITIGFIGNITGKLSNLGIDARDAIILGIDEINEEGGIKGKKINLIIEDDGFDKNKAIEGINKLIKKDPVLIIGHIVSAMSVATIPIINEKKILMISPTTVTNEINKKDDYFIRVSPPTSYTIKIFAEKIIESNIKELNIAYDLVNRAYSEDWFNTFKKEFEDKGGKVYPFSFDSSKEKVSKEFAKNISNKNIIIVASPIIAGLLTQYIKQISPKMRIFCAGWAMGPEFIENAGNYSENVVFSYNFDENTKNENYIKFKEKFFKRFGRNPSFTSTHAYETIMIIKDALANIDDYSADSIKKYILTKKVFDSLQDEKIEFDEFGDPKPVPVFIKIENGKFIRGF
ncbi:MAG TPA: ABC transporter substrate-binding protein [Spirochaetota bacterium]|nr:ABC transporter substrate-binding protein [Spirochaetota bacterium]HOM38267.1 ABC transporter substrate-binding protein [Spirochaetota bacterium]HPQ48515.1 ABC transporter substrate-binding protein [Spirochaetota bacterium]